MTTDIDKREAARLARVAKITSRSRGKVITASELMRRHGLPDDIASIDAGEKGPRTQRALFETHDGEPAR